MVGEASAVKSRDPLMRLEARIREIAQKLKPGTRFVARSEGRASSTDEPAVPRRLGSVPSPQLRRAAWYLWQERGTPELIPGPRQSAPDGCKLRRPSLGAV